MRALITGGAGFVGSHLVDRLLQEGYDVRVLDNLDPQVHGAEQTRPAYLSSEAELIVGDVRDPNAVAKALQDVQVLVHFAAAVGVGQSMYEIRRYTDINAMGAATLLDVAVNHKFPLERMLVASSMSIYGEGRYTCAEHGDVAPRLRPVEQLKARDWELKCPICNSTLTPKATDETKPIEPTSVYAINKRDHEELFLAIGRTYGIPTTALRFFNIYGSRQALSNPYTGVAAIFCSRMLNGHAPKLFEDGLQRRDFVHVSDIVEACRLAITTPEAADQVFNVGSGNSVNLRELFAILARELKFEGEPEILQEARPGDIRHCWADISKAQRLLGFEPKINFDYGVSELVSWVTTQTAVDSTEAAVAELRNRGLSI